MSDGQYLIMVTGVGHYSFVVDGIEGIEHAYVKHVLGGDEGAAYPEEIHQLRADLYGNSVWMHNQKNEPFHIELDFEDGSFSATLIMREEARPDMPPPPSWEELSREWSNKFLSHIKMPYGQRDKEIRAALLEFIRANSLFEKFVKLGVEIGEANARR